MLSNLYGRDVEVYSRKSLMTPTIILEALNVPTHTEPIRLLKQDDGYQLLVNPKNIKG